MFNAAQFGLLLFTIVIDNCSTWIGHEFSELDIRVLIAMDDGCKLYFSRAINRIF